MKRPRFLETLIFIILLAFALAFLITMKGHSETRQIKTEVDRVLVPVTVMDMQGRLIGGLDKGGCGAFRIWEDNIEQEILSCSVEDIPVSVVIVFDNSGSMKSKFTISQAALQEFVKAGNAKDEYSLVIFNDHATQLTDWVSPEQITQTLVGSGLAIPDGKTALLDALYLAVAQAKTGNYNRRVIILITDGGDNHSRYNEHDIKQAFKETDIQFYGIGIFPCNVLVNSNCEFPTLEEARGPMLLAELADMTGGRSYMIAPDAQGIVSGKRLSNLAGFISESIRDQYYLTYKPLQSKMHDGKYHKIKVRVKEPRGSHLGFLIPYTRNGYQANHE